MTNDELKKTIAEQFAEAYEQGHKFAEQIMTVANDNGGQSLASLMFAMLIIDDSVRKQDPLKWNWTRDKVHDVFDAMKAMGAFDHISCESTALQ